MAPSLLERLWSLIDRVGVPADEAAHQVLPRRLMIASLLVGVPACFLNGFLVALVGRPAPGLVVAGLGVWLVGSLFAYVVRPDAFALATVFSIGNQACNVLYALASGGLVESGTNALWGLTPPLLAAIVSGPRAAAFWLVVQILGVTFLAGVDPNAETALHVWFNLVVVGSLVTIAMSVFANQRAVALTLGEHERQRADKLLFDVLPKSVALRLKAGEVVTDGPVNVAVLFADVAGFTSLSATMAPEAVVRMLDALFDAIDDLADKHGVEKVKTIGDCVMVVSGLPELEAAPGARLASFALALRTLVESREFDGHKLTLRIGLHAGPAVASIIGKKRFLYDVWGDTVNIASRMESSGQAGLVQVSDALREVLGAAFVVEPRGEVDIKGKGSMKTWWLVSAAVGAV